MFAALRGRNDIAFIVVLLVVKVVLKTIAKSIIAELEDLVPAVDITIDFLKVM